MEARFFVLAWKPDFLFWRESQIFWRESQVFWRESRIFGFQRCKYRLKVASLLNGIASIDGMSPPCSFGCEYRWNVASPRSWVQVSTKRRFPAFSSKILFCGYRWNVASPRFLKFEVFSNLCFFVLFVLKFGLWISTEMLRLHDFWNFASIDEVSFPCDFEILEVSNGVRILPIFGFCKYRLIVASLRGFLENHFFCLKTRGS